MLRLVSESRLAQRPGAAPARPGPAARRASIAPKRPRRLRELGAGREVGEALLDQRIVAGVGNAIRNEACFAARVSPWRAVDELERSEVERLLGEVERIDARLARPRPAPAGDLPRDADRLPGCGGRVSSRGQGDDNRTAYWCPRCQT